MISSLQSYFEGLFNSDKQTGANPDHTIELATAALMIEISLADEDFGTDERHVIHELLTNTFSLTKDEINQLIETAEKEVDHAVSLYGFTRLLNDELDINDKINVIQNLWRVAYADSVVDKYEEYYIRKVADLLYVPHSEYIKAKLEAAD